MKRLLTALAVLLSLAVPAMAGNLLTNKTSNGDGTIFTWTTGGYGQIALTGVFNGATATLSMSPDAGVSWLTVADGAFTDTGGDIFGFAPGTVLKFTITSAGASTSISASIKKVI